MVQLYDLCKLASNTCHPSSAAQFPTLLLTRQVPFSFSSRALSSCRSSSRALCSPLASATSSGTASPVYSSRLCESKICRLNES